MASSPAFRLCRANHKSDMINVFEEMYKDESMVDVSLICDNGTIKGHRLVLSACSPYFRNILSQITNPNHYPIIIIKEMSFADLKAIIEFMYCGDVTVPQEQLESVLKSAEFLQVKGLVEDSSKEKCEVIKSKKRRRKRHSGGSNQTGSHASDNEGSSDSGDDATIVSEEENVIPTSVETYDTTAEIEPTRLLEQSMVTDEVSFYYC